MNNSSLFSSLARFRGPNNEGVLFLVLLVLVVTIGLLNPVFFSISSLFSILRAAIVPLIFALGVLIVMISGGIDVSFAAVAIFASYSTVVFVQDLGIDPGLPAIIVIAVVVGMLLGTFNGFVIALFRLPTLIVTLGTMGIFKGFLLAYVGSKYIANPPESMDALATEYLVSIPLEQGAANLHVLVVPVLVICVLVALLLRRTMFGRSIYAIGGDMEAARRAGFPVVRTQLLIYVLVGALAAFGGVMHVILGRAANPQDLVGNELDVLAAVVLGGASVFGGRGSVLGTFMGVLLIQVINNSLILAGVPTSWQRAAVGVLLIIGVGIQALSARNDSKKAFVTREAKGDS